MIRLTAMLVRNPALSHEQFLRHWHDVHGPLIRDTPELARHLLRYEQHPLTEDRGMGLGGFDGVAVQWLDSVDSLAAFVSEPAYSEVLAPDERRLLDMDHVRVTLTAEPVVVIDGDLP